MTNEELELKIRVVEELSEKAQGMINSLENLKKGAEKSGDGISKGFKMSAGEAAKFAAVLTGVQMSITGVLSTIKSFISDTFQWAENLKNMQLTTGMTSEQLQTLDIAAKQSGSSMEELTLGVSALNSKLDDVKNGVEGATEPFEKMGINIRELVNSGASVSDIMDIMGKKINETGEIGREAFKDVVGARQAVKMMPVITQSLDALQQKYRETGLIIDSSMVNKIGDLDNKWKMLKTTVSTAITGWIVKAAEFWGVLDKTDKAYEEAVHSIQVQIAEQKKLAGVGLDAVNIEKEKLRSLDDVNKKILEVKDIHKYSLEEQIADLKKYMAEEVIMSEAREKLAKEIASLEQDMAHEREETEKKLSETKTKLAEKELDIKKDHAEKIKTITDATAEFEKEREQELTDFINKQAEEQQQFDEQMGERRVKARERINQKIKDIETKQREASNNLQEQQEKEQTGLKSIAEKEKLELVKQFKVDGFKMSKGWDEMTEKEQKDTLDHLEKYGRLQGKNQADSQEWLRKERERIDNKYGVNKEKLDKKQADDTKNLTEQQKKDMDKARMDRSVELALIDEENAKAIAKFNATELKQAKEKNDAIIEERTKFEAKILKIRQEADTKMAESIKKVNDELDQTAIKLANLKDKTITVTVNVVENHSTDYYSPEGGWQKYWEGKG